MRLSGLRITPSETFFCKWVWVKFCGTGSYWTHLYFWVVLSRIKHGAQTSPRCLVVLPLLAHIPAPRWNSKGPLCQCPPPPILACPLQPWFVECRCQRGLLCRWWALLTCFPTAEAINVTPWHSLDCLTLTIIRFWDGDTNTPRELKILRVVNRSPNPLRHFKQTKKKQFNSSDSPFLWGCGVWHLSTAVMQLCLWAFLHWAGGNCWLVF